MTSPVTISVTPSSRRRSATSQLTDDVTNDDSDDWEDEFGLRERLSPVNASVHLFPPPGSYQPCMFQCQEAKPRRKSRGRPLVRRSKSNNTVINVTAVTCTSRYVNRSSSSSRDVGRDANKGISFAFHTQPLPDPASCYDVTPSTSYATSTSGDVDDAVAAAAEIRETKESSLSQCGTVASCCGNDMASDLTSLATTSTQAVVARCSDVDQTNDVESSIYEALNRRSSIEPDGYMALLRRGARESIMSCTSYESIPMSTMRSRRARQSVNDEDDMSVDTVTADEYLHPL